MAADGEASAVPSPPLTRDFDYALPPDRIARYPAPERSRSRLLTLSRSTGALAHRRFDDLDRLLDPGDLLVVNDTRVVAARLVGRKPTGARAEALLLKPARRDARGGPRGGERVWEALVRPGAKLKPGRSIRVADDLVVRILDVAPGGRRIVRLESPMPPEQAIRRFGAVPLPPYLERPAEPLDRDRYQTVYARRDGSAAAPTAGLHFTPELLARLERGGVRRTAVTLHVGPGTFRPVEAEDPSEHRMHAEDYRVPEEAARAYAAARRRGGRVWAVGTTVARTLESAASARGRIEAGSGTTRLFVCPPHEFLAVDALITNFHLPRSTPIMLVAAFAGLEAVREAYRSAVERGYRFYSYGDAMAVVP